MNSDVAKELLRPLIPSLDKNLSLIDDLALLANYKYDDYEMYGPGHRFLEHLCHWLKQFKVNDRMEALQFVRNRLIFVSRREMQTLVRCVYYDVVIPRVIDQILKIEKLSPFEYGKAYEKYFQNYLRRCLFVGLSDSAHIDFFRRQNKLNQEQVLAFYKASPEHCLDALTRETGHDKFWAIFLLDDFAGSGFTILHQKNKDTSKMEGSLIRVKNRFRSLIENADTIDICHYICSEKAQKHISECLEILCQNDHNFGCKIKYSSILRIPLALSVKKNSSKADVIAKMCERYYNDGFETSKTKALGGVKYGFGGSALPLVMYSNTPNNSIPLLWAEVHNTDHSFHALFRRIDRHKDEGEGQVP